MGIEIEGVIQYVHPTFLYEFLVDLFLFIFLSHWQKNRKYEGQVTYAYFAIYSFFRMLIEGLRSDSLMLGPIRISQIVSVILFVVFTGILLYKEKKCQYTSKKDEKCRNRKHEN